MKKLIFLFFCIISFTTSFSQILNPVKFQYSVVKKGDGIYDVHIKTMLEPHWHIYSVYNPDGGAQATAIKIKEGKTQGKIKESGKLISIHDNAFNVNQKFFEGKVDFIQTIKVKGEKNISGTIEYMVCNDHQCLPPKEIEFKIKI